MTFSPMPTTLEEAKKEILMWREAYKRMKQAAQPAQQTQVAKEDIAAAWIAGYYRAGYTNDGAYAHKMSDEFAEQWAAQPAQHTQGAKQVQMPAEFDFYAGVTMWVGDKKITNVLSKAQIVYEFEKGAALTNSARICIDVLLAAPSTKEKAE